MHRLLSDIAAEMLGEREHVTSPTTASPVVGLARTFPRQAAELIDNPGRSGSWDQVDVPLLQSMGRMSMAIVDSYAAAEREFPELAARLASPGGTFLDVGTGAGWLAIALARSHPHLSVVGIDIFQPALDLAQANVVDAGLTDRIQLRLEDATALAEPAGYDAIWLPLPFLPVGIVPAVLDAAVRSLRPGGFVLAGTFVGPPDPLAQLLNDLRTVRAGGHPWRADELVVLLTDAGLPSAREVERSWLAPVRLHVGQRA